MGSQLHGQEEEEMKCAACGEVLIKKKGEIDLRINGKLYMVRDVTFELCPGCGERVLSPEVSQNIFQKVQAREYEEEMIKIPVLNGTYG